VTELRKPFKMVINNSVKSRGDEFTEKWIYSEWKVEKLFYPQSI
jgi:hypothetical protein